LQEELDDIWNAAPKFPNVDATDKRIDVDSFIQIYRDIDDIFEEEEDEDKEEQEEDMDTSTMQKEDMQKKEEEEEEDYELDETTTSSENEQELKRSFRAICNDEGLVSKTAMKNWNEIKELLRDEELSEEEFDEMWEKIPKSGGAADLVDVDGFLKFNSALDDLFEYLEEEDDNDSDDEVDATQSDKSKEIQVVTPMFYGDDLPPGVVFAELANENALVGLDELKKWGDLQDMLKDGDLLPLELQNMYESIPKAKGSQDGKLDEEGFIQLYDEIYSLFEEVGDDYEDATSVSIEDSNVSNARGTTFSSKNQFLSLLEDLSCGDESRLLCGLDGTESEVQLVLEAATALENEPSNMANDSDKDIQSSDIAGEWELLYTTSSTMKFHKSLSGLVPPNGKFGGLIQKLKASKYLSDTEYVEKINAGPASFEVRVTGDWELRSSVSLFTGSKSVCINVVPDKVSYGLTNQKADHWKSLGPMNLLDISYLDEDLRIMRGTTSTDSIFVFKRIS
jgi:PAP_fibrillin.